MTAKSFEEWADSQGYSMMDERPPTSKHPRFPAIHTESAWQAWNASRAALLSPDVAGLVEECRSGAAVVSGVHKRMADAKSARNQAAGDEGAEYLWLAPEQTLEGRCAAALESLAAHNAALVAQLAERDAALILWARWYDADSSEVARDHAYHETLKLLGAPLGRDYPKEPT